LSNRMSGKSSQPSLARRKTRSDATLSPQVRKLDSSRTLPPTVGRQKTNRTSTLSTRQSSNSLHMGRAACSIPEHDDMYKRIERLKEALKKEKEQTKIIRDEYDEKESVLLRDRAKLRDELDQLRDDRVKLTQKHEHNLTLIAEQHRKVQGQLEINHQNEIKQIYQKNEENIADKNKVIDKLKGQIAELMKGQSAERQAQIAELRKKLIGAAQEANDLRTEILKLQGSRNGAAPPPPETERKMPEIRVALCMNCIVMQQALTMANAALKSKMKELQQINDNATKMRIGLQLNDLALESLQKSQSENPD
jgi:hypothetical protein